MEGASAPEGQLVAPQNTIHDQIRRRQVAGLLILLAIILAASIFHAGLANVFPKGWWHIW
jgi:hypothetical protein